MPHRSSPNLVGQVRHQQAENSLMQCGEHLELNIEISIVPVILFIDLCGPQHWQWGMETLNPLDPRHICKIYRSC